MNDLNEQSRKILSVIKRSRKILLHLHPGPDFDSVASVLAMKIVLEQLGKMVTIISGDDAPPQNADFLCGYTDIKPASFSDIDLSRYDLFISLDSETPQRVSNKITPKFPLPVTSVVIDHHKRNIGYADINLVAPQYCSTCEILFWLVKKWKVKLNKDAALCLYVGIWSDSGGFKYPETSFTTHEAAAELLKTGIDFSGSIRKLTSTSNLLLLAYGQSLARTEELFGGRVLLVRITTGDILKTGLSPADIIPTYLNVTDTISLSQDAVITAVVYEREELDVGISLRSNNLSDPRDVSRITTLFGGGGHAAAAGAIVKNTTLDQAVGLLLNSIQKTYPDLGQP